MLGLLTIGHTCIWRHQCCDLVRIAKLKGCATILQNEFSKENKTERIQRMLEIVQRNTERLNALITGVIQEQKHCRGQRIPCLQAGSRSARWTFGH